ncbi:MAG: hypothetical protein WCP21_11380, partial [Armatimonadota bacterium]
IGYLAQGHALPRLSVSGDPAAAVAGLPTPLTPRQTESSGKPPLGLRVIEEAAEGNYNLSLMAVAPAGARGADSSVLLDAAFGTDRKPKRPLLWLLLGRERVQLVSGKTSAGTVLASASWKPSAQPTALLVKRRAGSVAVLAGGTQLLRVRTDLPVGGLLACGDGSVTLSEASYQPIEAPTFGDDFMRDPGDPSPWTKVSGQWQLVGLGNEKQSVNGFWMRGEGSPLALTTVGDSWWEDYAASVAVRLDSEATCGLGALYQPDGDYVALLADAEPRAGASLRLVAVTGKQERVLAQRAGGLTTGQWYRLGVRLREGKLEGLLDGEPVLQAALPEARGGGIALLVRDGRARFDDVQVQPAAEPLAPPRREGAPAVVMPINLGPQDSLTWASPTAPWTANPLRPSLLWHTGHFGAAVDYTLKLHPLAQAATRRLLLAPDRSGNEAAWLSVTAELAPQGKETLVTIQAPGQTPVEKRLPSGAEDTLTIMRRGDLLTVLWDNRECASASGGSNLSCVGLEVEGPPVEVSTVAVQAPEVRDYVFGVAPTDWHTSGGTWEVASRWACDNRWSWFAGWGDGEFAVWNKHPIEGDVVMDYFVGIKMEAPGGNEATRGRDLNATLCGDQLSPRSGYSFILGGDGGVQTQLLRNGVVVAENPQIRVPGGYGVHHEWFHLRVSRIGGRVEMDLEGQPVFRYDDPQPLAGGYVGLWSRNSGILVPRVTIYR